jgi:hypothetical protein
MKRLQKVLARIDDYTPAEKRHVAVAACDEARALHDEILAVSERPVADEAFSRLDKAVETAERVFGFIEQVSWGRCRLEHAGPLSWGRCRLEHAGPFTTPSSTHH